MSPGLADKAVSPFGARQPRHEDARLITGRGRYVGDVELPRMLHVAFVRSVHAHARLRAIATTRGATFCSRAASRTAASISRWTARSWSSIGRFAPTATRRRRWRAAAGWR